MFNFFKRKQTKGKVVNESETFKDVVACLSFEVNKDGTINIVCDWPDFDDNNVKSIPSIAYYYALAIDAINKGYLHKDIIETLKQCDNDNPLNTLFVENTLVEIVNLKKFSNNTLKDSVPVISPLEVFRATE
tara:strand:- start:1666 stop:2061 length:396 start_codon:yes stop_codon:yes gene_type:complete